MGGSRAQLVVYATTKRRYCYPIEKAEFGQAPSDKQLFHALPVLCLDQLIPNFRL